MRRIHLQQQYNLAACALGPWNGMIWDSLQHHRYNYTCHSYIIHEVTIVLEDIPGNL